jgi:hypothetical protein
VWLVALCVVAAAAVGLAQYLSPYSMPYATPRVERPSSADDGTFDGLLDLARALPASSVVKVLWTHGMCTHPPAWIDDRVKRLADAVGGASETRSVRPVGKRGASLTTVRISTPGAPIDVMFLTWSPLTAPYKAHLAVDAVEVPYTRAMLNRELKLGLVNDCLIDVVVYSGPNGNDIRQAMNEAVCGALGGRFAGESCDVPAGESPAALALVTESLGSKLLFDAVVTIWNAAEASPDKTAIDRVAHSLAAIKVMYMLANQVPLLDAAGSMALEKALDPMPVEQKIHGSTHAAFSLLSKARTRAPAMRPITVVAFSDPNDLLSYRIVPAHLAENVKEFRVVNVLVSNGATYFAYVERPDTAHCGYPWNPYVFGMLARGYQAGKPLPSVAGPPGGSCPNYLWTGAAPAK